MITGTSSCRPGKRVEIALALGAAVAYGASDFVGGFLSKKAAAVLVVLLSQFASLAMLFLVTPLFDNELTLEAIAWGAAAGVAGGVGAALLYRGLANGQMSVVAPISAVLAAGIPVVFGLTTGERPGAIALAGVGLGLVAVVAVSQAPSPEGIQARSGLLEALGAGTGFGVFFVLLERSPEDSGLWPLIGMRFSMMALMATLLVIAKTPRAWPKISPLQLAGLGLLNGLADLLYLLATREGLLALVAVITSFYPAATVVLAAVFLRERMTRPQAAGLAFAGVSVALIALR